MKKYFMYLSCLFMLIFGFAFFISPTLTHASCYPGHTHDDFLEGGPGDDDIIPGGTGDDLLDGGPGGSDILEGGPGEDPLPYDGTCSGRLDEFVNILDADVNGALFMPREERDVLDGLLDGIRDDIPSVVNSEDTCLQQEEDFMLMFLDGIMALGTDKLEPGTKRVFEVQEVFVGELYNSLNRANVEFPYIIVPTFENPGIMWAGPSTERDCKDLKDLIDRFTKLNASSPTTEDEKRLHEWRESVIKSTKEEFEKKCPTKLEGSLNVKTNRNSTGSLLGAGITIKIKDGSGSVISTHVLTTDSTGKFHEECTGITEEVTYELSIGLREDATEKHKGKVLRYGDCTAGSDNSTKNIEISYDLTQKQMDNISNLDLSALTPKSVKPAGLSNKAAQEALKNYVKANKALDFMAELGITIDKPIHIYIDQNWVGAKFYEKCGDYNIRLGRDNFSHLGDFPMNSIWHEMGHYADQLNRGDKRRRDATHKNHGGRLNSDSRDSMSEGFAEWFSLEMKKRDPSNTRFPNKRGLYEITGTDWNIEDNNGTNVKRIVPAGSGFDLGGEMGVAGIMYDLTDTPTPGEITEMDKTTKQASLPYGGEEFIARIDMDRIALTPKDFVRVMKGSITLKDLYDNLVKEAKAGKLKNSNGSSVSVKDLEGTFLVHGAAQDLDGNSKLEGDEIGLSGTGGTPRRTPPPDIQGGAILPSFEDMNGNIVTETEITYTVQYDDPQINAYYGFSISEPAVAGEHLYFYFPFSEDGSIKAIFEWGGDRLEISNDEYWSKIGEEGVTEIAIHTFKATQALTGGDSLFPDVLSSHKNHKAIMFLKDKGVIQGYPDGTFGPANTINRAEMMKILVESKGVSPDPEKYKNCFPDVLSEWFAKYVCYAKEQNWVAGYPDGTYKPGQTVNKVEALKMILNAFNVELPGSFDNIHFDDADPSAWYAAYLSAAIQLQLLEEGDKSIFGPADGGMRAWFSEVVYRLMNL